jgi:hypothetical protein
MPKPGFKSITVSENIYKKFFEVYEKNKKGLELKGIMSFSGYLTSRMEEMMIKDKVFAKHSPRPCLRTGPYPRSHTLQQQHLQIWHY